MTYYPMIKVTAEKFSEYWNGQALSDTIRCMSDGLVAFSDFERDDRDT